MPLLEATRENVVAYISTLVKVPVEELTDDMQFGGLKGIDNILPYIVLKFGKPVIIRDTSNFTIGDLVAQLNKK